jgi:hypothetical protein
MPSVYDPFRGFPLQSRLMVPVQQPLSLQQQRDAREAILCHICLKVLANLAQSPAQWVTLEPAFYPLPQHLKALGLYHDAIKVWDYLSEMGMIEREQTSIGYQVRLTPLGWQVVTQELEILPDRAPAWYIKVLQHLYLKDRPSF